jgi:hypothetical protein
VEEVEEEEEEEEAARGQEEAKGEEVWYGMGQAGLTAINDAFEALDQSHNFQAPMELLVPGSPLRSQFIAFLKSRGMSHAEAEGLVTAYAEAAARQREDRARKEREYKRQQDILVEDARRLAEELARQAAEDAARAEELRRQLAVKQRELERLATRKPLVHCFGGCNQTAPYWSPCATAPRQIGWRYADGTDGPM